KCSRCSNIRGTEMYAIIGAMDEEIAEFLAHARVERVVEKPHFKVHEGVLCGATVAIVKCGVGKVFASLITQYLIDRYAPEAVITQRRRDGWAPEAVVSSGGGGGLAPRLSIGDVVASRDCSQHDMDVRALGFDRGHIPYSELRIFWGDEPLLKRALRAKLESG